MTTNTVLERYPEIDYVLVWRHDENGWQEYVAAWHYDDATGTWGQGHYFQTIRGAMQYIEEKYGNSPEKLLEKVIDHATDYVAARAIDYHESKATAYFTDEEERVELFSWRLWGMQDLLEDIQEYVAEMEAE